MPARSRKIQKIVMENSPHHIPAASSDDVRLSGSFQIDGDLWIEGKEREFWAVAASTS